MSEYISLGRYSFFLLLLLFYTLPHNSGGVLWYRIGCPCVHLSYVRLSIFLFTDNNSKYRWISPYSVCTLILWRSGFRLLMGKFRQFLAASSACNMSVFSFPDDNSKHQWIFTKLGLCIDILETCFGIANGQISSIFDSYLRTTHLYFHFWTITYNKLISMDFHQTWYVHWYCGNLLWDC